MVISESFHEWMTVICFSSSSYAPGGDDITADIIPPNVWWPVVGGKGDDIQATDNVRNYSAIKLQDNYLYRQSIYDVSVDNVPLNRFYLQSYAQYKIL